MMSKNRGHEEEFYFSASVAIFTSASPKNFIAFVSLLQNIVLLKERRRPAHDRVVRRKKLYKTQSFDGRLLSNNPQPSLQLISDDLLARFWFRRNVSYAHSSLNVAASSTICSLQSGRDSPFQHLLSIRKFRSTCSLHCRF